MEERRGPGEETTVPHSGGVEAGDPGSVTPEINTHVAHTARVYDYWLGGKDNFPADHALAEAILEAVPSMRAMARANRAFLGRAVSYLAGEAGIRQFLDIGTGIPTAGNTHEVAQAVAPDARVVYVDNDPIVLAHARALMSSHVAGRTAFIFEDLRQPDAILSDPELVSTLELDQPVALMLVAILMFLRGSEGPYGIVSRLLEALPSGSYLAISHPTADFDEPAMAGAVAASKRSGIDLVPRSHAEVERFFTGLELVEPGVLPVTAWRPDGQPPAEPVRASSMEPLYIYAGVGRKP
jgi:SAM-dependent methyltransferase